MDCFGFCPELLCIHGARLGVNDDEFGYWFGAAEPVFWETFSAFGTGAAAQSKLGGRGLVEEVHERLRFGPGAISASTASRPAINATTAQIAMTTNGLRTLDRARDSVMWQAVPCQD